MDSNWTLRSGSVAGMPLVPPSQPTHAPSSYVAITGRSAVTRPPGESSQPSSPCRTGSLLAMATTVTLLSLTTHPGVKHRSDWFSDGQAG